MKQDKLEALLLYIAKLEYVGDEDLIDEFDAGYLTALRDIRIKIKKMKD